MADHFFTGKNKHLGKIENRSNGDVAVHIDFFAGDDIDTIDEVLKTEGEAAGVTLEQSDGNTGNSALDVEVIGSVDAVAEYLGKYYEGDSDKQGILDDLRVVFTN